MDPAELASTIQLGNDLVSSKYYLVAGTVVLVYDYLLTLSDEIRYGWEGNKSWMFALFIANRYLSLVYSTWVNIAFLLPSYSVAMCNRTAFIESLWTAIAMGIAQTFLMLRMYALTNKNKILLGAMSTIVTVQFIFSVVLSSLPGNKGMPIPAIPLHAYHACILFPPNQMADIAFLSIGLTFDGIVFFITLASSIMSARSFETSAVVRVLLRDGIVYFFVIFSHAFIWMMFIARARPSLKFLPAQTHILLLSVMVNRLTLSLRKASRRSGVTEWGMRDFQLNHSQSYSQGGAIPLSNLSLRGE